MSATDDVPTPPTRRRDYVDNATARKQILEAAAELFRARGFHATSVREIGDHLGIGQSSLYYHAKNKTQILLDLNEGFMNDLVDSVDEIVARDATGFEKLDAIVRELLAKIAENRDIVTVVLHERRSLPRDAAVLIQAKRDHVDAVIDRILLDGIEDRTIRDVPIAVTRLAVTGMSNWAYTWFDPNGPLSADEIADGFLDLLRTGLGGPALHHPED